MCIYCGTPKYRKIYENHYGEIPIDENGRIFEIHHIDGDHDNNHYTNLMAVTIHEHYDIHKSNGDWGACFALLMRISKSPKELSDFSRKVQKQRIANGTHNFLGDNNPVHKLVADGTHNFIGGEIGGAASRQRVKDGSHNFLDGEISRKTVRRQLEDGSHPFLSEYVRGSNKRRVEAETHHLLGGEQQRKLLADGKHPSQIERTCLHCGLTGHGPGMKRWHMDNCRSK